MSFKHKCPVTKTYCADNRETSTLIGYSNTDGLLRQCNICKRIYPDKEREGLPL